jgi:hypothetical protein
MATEKKARWLLHLEAHNRARTEPQSLIPLLKRRAKLFVDKNDPRICFIRKGYKIMTHEGVEAVQEAIEFLSTVKPTYRLTWNRSMTRAARDHALDQEATKKVGHKGSDGSMPVDRLSRHGKAIGLSGENIVYGFYKDPLDHIVTMIIDDGVKSRVHRHNLFNECFRHMACFEATHKVFKRVVVFTYAESFVEPLEDKRFTRINLEVQAFLQEPVLFDQELEALGLKAKTPEEAEDAA